MLQRLICTLMISMACAFAMAQDESKGLKIKAVSSETTGNVHALIVGISAYKHIPKLQYADVDAKDFYQYLHLSFPQDRDNIRYFLNGDATREAIADHLYSITEKAKKGDVVYVFLSGHGDIEHLSKTDNTLFLLSGSPDKNYLRKTEYVDLNLLRDFFNDWQSKDIKTVFIADACHSGGLSGGEQGRNNTLLSLRQNWDNEIKLLSCQPNELSLESKRFGGGRGLFSYYLTLGLRGLADKDNNKVITLKELDQFIRDSVSFHSDESQLPATQGDLRFSLAKYRDSTLKVAKVMLAKKIPLFTDALAFRSAGSDVIRDLITDEPGQKKYQEFLTALEENRLVSPAGNCAVSSLKFFEKDSLRGNVFSLMRTRLIDATQKRFYELTNQMYDDNFEAVPLAYIDVILKESMACLEFLNKNHYSYKKLQARIAFLESCKATHHLDASFRQDQYASLLRAEIKNLEAAAQTDPMQPYLYLKIGDYALYLSDFEKAISNYRQYQSFLPNDEYTYNKLGMAYAAQGKYQNAYDELQKSVRINSKFAKGYYNLYVVCDKMGKKSEADKYAKLAAQYGKAPATKRNDDEF